MNKLKINLISCMLIFLVGCNGGRKDSKLHFFTSIESSYAYQNDLTPSVAWSGEAYSGNYVCRLDSATPYSVTFSMKMYKITGKQLKSVSVKAWVNMSAMTSDPMLVVDIKDSTDQSIEWLSRSAKDFVGEPNHWEEVEFKVNLTEKQRNRSSNSLRIYLMNTKKDFALVDDIEVSFEEN